VKAKTVTFLQYTVKMIGEVVQCYLLNISVVSTPVLAFRSPREQPFNLYNCSSCLILEIDVLLSDSINSSQMRLSIWEFFPG